MIENLIGIGLIVFLIFVNGFCVAGEFAIVGVRRSQIQKAAENNDKRARLLLKYLDSPDRFIAICQLGVTIASLGLGWLSEPYISKVLVGLLDKLPLEHLKSYIHPFSFIVAFTFITIIHIIAGEQVPKMMSLQKTRTLALNTVTPIHYFGVFFKPLIWILIILQAGTARLLGLKSVSEHGGGSLSDDELKMMIILAARGGIIEDREKDLVLRSISFVDFPIEQIMVPRIYVKAIDVKSTCAETITLMNSAGNSRIPIYEDTVDKIIGIAYLKDIAPLLITNQLDASSKVIDVSRKPLFLPATLKAYDALEALQKNKIEFAVVVDEHGGTAGIITTEDLIEELVGEIFDEFDAGETGDLITVNPDKSMLIKGRMPLTNFVNLTNLKVENDKYHTVAGLVLDQLGRKARKGDLISIGSVSIEVISVDKQTVKVLLIKKEG